MILSEEGGVRIDDRLEAVRYAKLMVIGCVYSIDLSHLSNSKLTA
jgi:hypothetical protein